MRSDARYADSAARPHGRPWSLVVVLDALITLIVMALISWLLSIVLEWLGMALGWWSLPGAAHSEHLLNTELAWLGQDFLAAAETTRPVRWAEQGAALWYHYSGMGALLEWVATPQTMPLLETWRLQMLALSEYLLAAGFITQLIGARLAVVVLSVPVYALAACVGLIDGLVQRDLRRFGGGAESGFTYHHLKKILGPLIWVPVLVYLATPWPLHPTMVFVPPALLFGWLIAKTAARFKKYL